VDYCSQEVMGS